MCRLLFLGVFNINLSRVTRFWKLKRFLLACMELEDKTKAVDH